MSATVETVTQEVIVQGQRYEIEVGPNVSLRLLAACALKRHGEPHYLRGVEWEIRDEEGNLVTVDEPVPDEELADYQREFVAMMGKPIVRFKRAVDYGKLYINPRPGVGA